MYPVNTETIRKYPLRTVDNMAPWRITTRKKFMPVSAGENRP